MAASSLSLSKFDTAFYGPRLAAPIGRDWKAPQSWTPVASFDHIMTCTPNSCLRPGPDKLIVNTIEKPRLLPSYYRYQASTSRHMHGLLCTPLLFILKFDDIGNRGLGARCCSIRQRHYKSCILSELSGA
ncbi:hypothetical protein FIBSPDRAFT_869943 [Athelia psychrophila]|uniref:Uncharacterized protein n=1 Tax=Athelia psychrophila TaxID=1759441 RepID=A0A166BNH2_9AGAM|nr:hypothetical protein FIBSPDRAFT_869943 [Fibularhizoctonia sp. CBS 109695]